MGGVLYIVGLGLGPGQVTEEALRVLRGVGVVFVEEYTSMFEVDVVKYLGDLLGRPVVKVSRRDLEDEGGKAIIKAAKELGSAALVTIGDPMLATTHSAVLIEARRSGVEARVINGVSILCAAFSQAGLSMYRLGPVATVTYRRGGVLSRRAYDVLASNLSNGLHTLLLLDIRDDGGFMSITEAVGLLREVEGEVGLGVVNEDLIAVFESRIGWSDQAIAVNQLINPPDLKPPSVIIVPGMLNPVEEEYLRLIHGADEELIIRHMNRVKSMMAKGLVGLTQRGNDEK